MIQMRAFSLLYTDAYKFSIGNSDNTKKLTFDGSDLLVTGAIQGGSIQSNNTNPIPTNVFTRTDNQNIPTGDESGAFIDLASGSFLFGDADNFVSFAENSDATAFELDIKGVLAPTKLDFADVTDTTVMPDTIKVSGYTDASIGKNALSEEAYDEIARRVGNTGGFYATATGFYLGSTKNIAIASTQDHGTQDVRVKVSINDVFTYPRNWAAGDNALKITVKLFAKREQIARIFLLTRLAQRRPSKYANTPPVQPIHHQRSYEVVLASGTDIEDSTDYDFKVELTRVANPNAFKSSADGGATTRRERQSRWRWQRERSQQRRQVTLIRWTA